MSQYGSIGAGAFSGDMEREKQYQADEQARFNRRMQRQQFEEEQKRNKPKMVSVKDEWGDSNRKYIDAKGNVKTRKVGGFAHTRRVSREDLEWEENHNRKLEEWKQKDEDRKRTQEREDKESKAKEDLLNQQWIHRNDEHERKKKEWKAQDEDRKRAQEREDKEWDAQRKDAEWNQGYQQREQEMKQQSLNFQQMLAQDELERKREMRRREDAQYEQLMKQQADARAQQEASFASLLRYGVQAGDMGKNGMILIPPAYIDQFNKTNGSQLGGIAILTRNDRGEALDYPQVMLMNRDAQGQVVPGGVMSNAQVRMMFEAFPDVSEEMAKKAGLTGGSGNSAWLRALGVKTPTARNEERSDSASRRDAVEYYKSALEMIGKRKAALMVHDSVTDKPIPPNKADNPQAYDEFQRLLQDERYYQDAWGRLIGIDARPRVGDGASANEAGSAPKQENKPKWRPKHNLGKLGMRGAL